MLPTKGLVKSWCGTVRRVGRGKEGGGLLCSKGRGPGEGGAVCEAAAAFGRMLRMRLAAALVAAMASSRGAYGQSDESELEAVAPTPEGPQLSRW